MSSTPADAVPLPRLTVSEDGRYLVTEGGQPFFYLADTAWELFQRLDRQESERYLADRAAKAFTVIQAVVLAEEDGLRTPNRYGDLPLIDRDPTRPNEAYFQHVDAVVDAAERLGLHIGMLPTWGDKWLRKWGVGPVIFTPDSAEVYGEYVGRRYRDKPIIWILGGDRSPENDEHLAIIRAMARGLRRGDGGRHLMTFHPSGGAGSSRWFHEDDWLDFNMIQSGHDRRNGANYDMIAADYAGMPVKPCMDGEPCYEDHPVRFDPANGWFDDYDVRKAAYWSVFAGAHGHTYGCHDIWQMLAPGRQPVTYARTPWYDAMALPGAGQMRHLRALMESRPFLSRVPDEGLLAPGAGERPELTHLVYTRAARLHVGATRDRDGSYAMVFIAEPDRTVRVDAGSLSGERLNAWWYDPRTGAATAIHGDHRTDGALRFTTPSGGPDWVLVLDDVDAGYPPPGVPLTP